MMLACNSDSRWRVHVLDSVPLRRTCGPPNRVAVPKTQSDCAAPCLNMQRQTTAATHMHLPILSKAPVDTDHKSRLKKKTQSVHGVKMTAVHSGIVHDDVMVHESADTILALSSISIHICPGLNTNSTV